MICGTDRSGRREAAGIVARGDPGLSSPVLDAARHEGGVRDTRPDEVLLPAAGRSQITTEARQTARTIAGNL